MMPMWWIHFVENEDWVLYDGEGSDGVGGLVFVG